MVAPALFFFPKNILNIIRGYTANYLLGLILIFLLATPVLANVVSIGFDKSEYLIEPDIIQRINVQLQDSSGLSTKASETTDVYLTAESQTAAISTKVSEPYSFISPVLNIKLTVSKNTAQRGFMYKDSVLGSSTITATGSARTSGTVLFPGNLKITIGFPPPPPPAPAPAPVQPAPAVSTPISKPNVVAAPVTPTIPKPVLTPVPESSSEPDRVNEATTSAELNKLNIGSLLTSPEPTVLAASDIKLVETSFFDELLSWLEQFIFDKIWL